jgi:hypothetical protein
MKNKLLLIILSFPFMFYAQDFTWDSGTQMRNDGSNSVTETVNGVTITATTSSGGANLSNGGGASGTTGNVVIESSFSGYQTMTFTFDSPLTVNSLFTLLTNSRPGTESYTFTPSGGTNSVVVTTISTDSGTDVPLNWSGVNSFTVSRTDGQNDFLAFDTISIGSISTAPTVSTSMVSSITNSSANLGGNITASGGATVSDRGVVYSSTDSTPQIGEMEVVQEPNGTGTGMFNETISGLTPNTSYNYAAYAINNEGTSYGMVRTFTTTVNTAPLVSVTNTSPTIPNSNEAVTVTATASDFDNDMLNVTLSYGTSSTNPSNIITMINTGGNTYTANIPAQPAGTTIFYRVRASDSYIATTSSIFSYTVTTSGLQVMAADTSYSINFDSTTPGINNGSFAGTGLTPAPIAGRLNSNGVLVNGLSDGDTTIGGTLTSGDYARGVASRDVSAGGIYAFDVSNGGTVDRALGIQPGGNDFEPGSIAIRFENRTGAVINVLAVSFEIFTFDNTQRTNSYNFAHGRDIATAIEITDLNFNASGDNTTVANTLWKANYLQTDISGLNIANGASYYLVWNSDFNTGGGVRPQFAIDDITIIANPSSLNSNLSGSYENVIIDGNTSITNASSVVRSLAVTGGNLLTNDNLTFKSNAARSAILKEFTTGSIIGEVIVEQFYPATRAFRFVSSPVNMSGSIFANWQENGINTSGFGTQITGGLAIDGFDRSGSNAPSMFQFNNAYVDEANNWDPVQSTDIEGTNTITSIAGSPYRMFVRGDRTIDLTANVAPNTTTLRTTGVLKTGDVFENLANVNTSGNFVFIGNPYQAQVDLSQTLSNASSEDINTNFYYAWQPNTNNYVTYDFTAGGVQNGVTNLIQPGQSFFAMTDENTGSIAGFSPSITFSENQKTDNTLTTATYSTPFIEGTSVRIALNQSGDNSPYDTDVVTTRFTTGGNNEIDDLDAKKLTGVGEQLYIMSNSSFLSIENRDVVVDATVINLGIGNMSNGTYVLALDIKNLVGFEPVLVDDFLNSSTVLFPNNETLFTFNVDLNNAGSFAYNRFHIEFTTTTLGNGDTAFAKAVQLYPNPIATDILNISGLRSGKVSVTVTNLLGQQVHQITNEVSGSSTQINGFDNLNSGIHLVTLTQEGQSVTKRVVVQ